MLLFIRCWTPCQVQWRNFKTSYVTVYRSLLSSRSVTSNYFKTSYVTVYHPDLSQVGALTWFQNIVCYCLSILLFHCVFPCVEFQNIVCYCLSCTGSPVIPSKLKFQNIVCYCLSWSSAGSIPAAVLFQNIVCYCLSHIKHIPVLDSTISKHRMLLFIEIYDNDLELVIEFQNIVCYCLSIPRLILISKHRMLLFIPLLTRGFSCGPYFKTSYVTVYQCLCFR